MLETFNTDMFHWDPMYKEFIQEASVLRIRPTHNMKSFLLQSHKTGKVVIMKLVSTENSIENEILSWCYAPIAPAMEFTVVIFND